MNNINLVGHIAQDITIKESHVSLKIGLKRNYKDALKSGDTINGCELIDCESVAIR